MAKKVMALIKLQVAAGKANPSPPIGPALGQHGVNIMDFCKAFNARNDYTRGDNGFPGQNLQIHHQNTPSGCSVEKGGCGGQRRR